MHTSSIVVVLSYCLVGCEASSADDKPVRSLEPLLEPVQKLVQKYYPKATVALKDQIIHFEYNTRKFMIRNAYKCGEWQDAHEEIGPKNGGIFGDIELRVGRWGGQAAVPQTFDERYFKERMLAPYSKKLDLHVLVSIKYPRDASKEFLKEFEELMNEFERQYPHFGK